MTHVVGCNYIFLTQIFVFLGADNYFFSFLAILEPLPMALSGSASLVSREMNLQPQ